MSAHVVLLLGAKQALVLVVALVMRLSQRALALEMAVPVAEIDTNSILLHRCALKLLGLCHEWGALLHFVKKEAPERLQGVV